MQSVFFLTYASRMTWRAGMNKNVFADIYHTSNKFNATQGITGFLCFGDGYFFQYLEGDETKVRQLYASICQDKRHTKITLLSTGHLPAKRFAQWDMAFVNMHSPSTDPKIEEFFGLLTPLRWQDSDINHIISLFENSYNTPEYINRRAGGSDLIYRYAGMHHLFRQHRNFLIFQGILLFIITLVLVVSYFW